MEARDLFGVIVRTIGLVGGLLILRGPGGGGPVISFSFAGGVFSGVQLLVCGLLLFRADALVRRVYRAAAAD